MHIHTPLQPIAGQPTNSDRSRKRIFKTKVQDFTDGRWVKVEGAAGNMMKFIKNKK